MPKLLFLPKWEQQCAKRIARDSVATSLLPMKPIVRIAICQDGRTPAGKSKLQFEAAYFEVLYNHYLYRPDITVQCYAFSFEDPPATLEQHLRELETIDIFFMTGFSPGRFMSESLMQVFKQHAVVGNDERDLPGLCELISSDQLVVENLFRSIKARVQYNQMMYVGVCGGACCGGRLLWSRLVSGALGPTPREFELFDFCMGVSLHYDCGMPPADCNTNVITRSTFQITGGAGLAVHIENDIALSSSFPCIKNNSWNLWCARATDAHQRVVEQIAEQNVSGPWFHPSVGIWHLAVNGQCFTCTARL